MMLALSAATVSVILARSPSESFFSEARLALSLENSPSDQAMAFFRSSLANFAAEVRANWISSFIWARASLVWRFSSLIWEWMDLDRVEISEVMRLFIEARVLALMS